MNSDIKILNIRELSDLLGVPVATIYFWKSSKKIPYIKPGKELRFILSDVLEYFKKQTRK